MNGIKNKPKFLDNTIPDGYFEPQNPYKIAPSCNISLLELSRYARKIGKKIVDLTAEEINQFKISQ